MKRVVDFKKMREEAEKNKKPIDAGVTITDDYKGKNSDKVLKCSLCGKPRKRGCDICDECKKKAIEHG